MSREDESEEAFFRRMDSAANMAAVILSLFLLALLGGIVFIVRM